MSPSPLMREDYQALEDIQLAPYAVKSGDCGGRKHKEKEHRIRTPFQRDRDRILHSTAFRRLEYKTQVFVNHEGDHYRTRLTHTLETCQVAKSIARSLRLNEDLVEAIALAHDIGHGPFGHAGEWALQEIMRPHGGFEHNQQCLRIVEELEQSYPAFSGLNLTHATLEGLKKHPEKFYRNKKPRFKSLEAEVVDLADEIAYNSHDLDDGLRSGLICEEDLLELEIWSQAIRYIKKQKYKKIVPAQRQRLAIRLILNQLVMDLITYTSNQIQKKGIKRRKQLHEYSSPIVKLSPTMRRQLAQLRKFLYKNLYRHHRVVRMTDKGQRFLKILFHTYADQAAQLPPEIQGRIKKDGVQRAICDYLASMTDRFALDEYKRLFEPYERV